MSDIRDAFEQMLQERVDNPPEPPKNELEAAFERIKTYPIGRD